MLHLVPIGFAALVFPLLGLYGLKRTDRLVERLALQGDDSRLTVRVVSGVLLFVGLVMLAICALGAWGLWLFIHDPTD